MSDELAEEPDTDMDIKEQLEAFNKAAQSLKDYIEEMRNG